MSNYKDLVPLLSAVFRRDIGAKTWTPLQLSLDNAWCHHSHSLEDIASEISMNGRFNSIDLVFRKPYKARYGALIERFFGTISARIQERLEGAFQSSHPKDVRNAAQRACLAGRDSTVCACCSD